MPEIESIKNSKVHYRLNINPMEYYTPQDAPTMFHKQLKDCDDTDPVFIDSYRLMNCWAGLRAKDFKYYYYLLSKLNRNDEAIRLNHQEVRQFFRDKSVQIVSQAINRLVIHGLIFRPARTRGCYIINPAYAWKGNRLDYLDKSIFK